MRPTNFAAKTRRPSASHFERVQATRLWQALHSDLVAMLPPGEGRQVLDIGCGPGLLCRMLQEAGYEVVGVDREPDMITAARTHAADRIGLIFAEGDATALQFPAASFDLVVMTNLLFFLVDPLIAVREMARVCRPGGQVVVLNPAPWLNSVSATELADRLGIADNDRWVLLNWARLAELNGTIDEELWRTMATLADLDAITWAHVGVGGIGALASAARPSTVVSHAG
ncbi:MAG: class I SAM-dependent methyltransferase [Solirubrobacteraceae bacterium]